MDSIRKERGGERRAKMKPKNYVILMVAAIAAMVLVQFAPCRANWVYLGSDGSSGLPDSDSDSEDGYEYEWSWSYSVSGISRGGNSGGSWASASFSADELAEVWSFGGGTSESASPDNPQPCVWGDSYYADIPNPNYTADPIEVKWDVYASGTVTVEGSVDDGDLGGGDSVDSDASASGSAGGYESGGGYVSGSVSENSTGSAYAGVYGEATEDDDPDITESAGYYYATLSFTVDAYDSDPYVEGDPPNDPGPNSFGASAGISVYADASASISASQGHIGGADTYATVSFSGYGIVNVTLP